MRQDWLATWESGGVVQEYRFTSLSHEGIARLHLVLELKELKPPLSTQACEPKLERLGEPYDIRVVPRSRTHLLL